MLRDLQWLRDRKATRDESPAASFTSNDAPVGGGRKRSYAHGDSLHDGAESGDGEIMLPPLPAHGVDQDDQRLGLSPVADVADEPDPLEEFGSLEGERDLRHRWTIIENSTAIAEQVSGSVELGEVRSLLDISGQAGALSTALCKHHSKLDATVFDPPQVGPRNRVDSFVTVERPEADSRVTFIHSSSHVVWYDALSINHDALLMQHGSGCSTDVTMQTLYGRAFQGLRPRGLLLVHQFLTDNEELAAQAEVQSASTAMVDAGFVDVQQIDLGYSLGHLLIGSKAQ